jgi:signal transduction histidine kinase
LGSTAQHFKDFKKAKAYFSEVINEKNNKCNYSLPYAIMGFATVESEEGYAQRAMVKLNDVLTMFRKSGDRFGENICLQTIATTQVKLKQYSAALKNALLSRELALSINDKSNLNEITKQLPNLYAKNGKYKEAYLYAMQYQVIADSLYFGLQGLNQKFALQFQERAYKSQLRQQALKNQYTQAMANRNLIGMILFAAIGVIVFLFYRNRTLRTEKATLVLREEARKKNEELRAFNHTIGHDLKSPVENMQMLLQQFSMKFAGKLDRESSLYLQKIGELNQDTRLMIDGLLKYAEQDQMPIQVGVFETLRIVTYITRALQDANPDKNIVFKLNQLVDQQGDPLMLRHVFVNLLQNAVKFSSSQNPIVIEVSSGVTNNERVYCIKDNGVGFPPGSAERIFELFKTVHDRASFPGSGIGLAIVKPIIERHGGKVWAEANPEGGAIFRFSLPLA